MVWFRFVHPFVRRIRGLTQTNCLAKETVRHPSNRDSGMDVYGAQGERWGFNVRPEIIRPPLGRLAVISLSFFFYELFHNTYHSYSRPLIRCVTTVIFIPHWLQTELRATNDESANCIADTYPYPQYANIPNDIIFSRIFFAAQGRFYKQKLAVFYSWSFTTMMYRQKRV